MARSLQSLHDQEFGLRTRCRFMKSKFLQIILSVVLIAVVISGFATTWNQTSAPGGPYRLGMSADGRIIMAVNTTSRPVISTNWGQSWTTVTNSPPWGGGNPDSIAMSADGATIIATLTTNATTPVQTWVFITTNYGGAWTGTGLMASNAWGLAVACSADATRMIAGIANGPICYSTNAGVNWYTSSAPHADWVSVASSTDGRHMAAIVSGGKLYFSSDFGATWTPTNLPALSWNLVCLSSEGNWVGATGTGGTYISSNAGASWTTHGLSGNALACSANGTNWILAEAEALDATLFTSSDGGLTWVSNLSACVGPVSSCSWGGAAVSADGCEFMAADGFVWAGYNTPSPQLNIQSSDQALNLSWLIPSTNFVLQQNPDLTTTNWTAISNTPVLNFTNLQQQVSVPSSPSNTFFRLIAQ